jgi:hypothetical protein
MMMMMNNGSFVTKTSRKRAARGRSTKRETCVFSQGRYDYLEQMQSSILEVLVSLFPEPAACASVRLVLVLDNDDRR